MTFGQEEFTDERMLDEIVSPREVPAADRPVEMLYQQGWFVLRVPGLKVLTRQAKAGWREYDDFCSIDPKLRMLWGDETTGLGVVLVDHISGACLCEDPSYFHAVTLPPTAFEALAARPSERYTQHVDAACEADPDIEFC